VRIFGDAGFSGGSEATSSPVTTDADGDAIAANFPPISLADGEFIRLTGSVTLDAPLTGSDFRIGLFDGEDPVLAGDGTGYGGIWSEAPATSDTNIAAGDGSGSPFETATAMILGPVSAAAATVPANTPIDFTLMIARNGNDLEISTNFTDNGIDNPSQNLLKQAVAKFGYDRVAFLTNGNLSGSQARFSNIEMVSGSVLPGLESVGVTSRVITYVDALEGVNTFATGGSLETTAWVGPSASSSNDTQWNKRDTFGNDASIFQAIPDGSAAGIPELTTEITGLADGTYILWAFFWDQVENDTQNWTVAAGLTSGSLITYSAPGEPSVSGATSIGVANAANLSFANTAPGIKVADDLIAHYEWSSNLDQFSEPCHHDFTLSFHVWPCWALPSPLMRFRLSIGSPQMATQDTWRGLPGPHHRSRLMLMPIP
jgi:hypothetical protein